jgi:5'-3' exonuclease
MPDWENVRVIFSQHKCRPTRGGKPMLSFIAAQGAKETSQIGATIP